MIQFNLFTNYYTDANVSRQAELDYCFLENLDVFDHIIVACTQDDFEKLPDNDKIIPIITDKRPTFSDYFDMMNTIAFDDNCINIIANLDIIIPKSTLVASETYFAGNKKTCLALTRWDLVEGFDLKFRHCVFYNHADSQDTWIFHSKVKDVEGDFCLGKPGCDNAIAYILDKAGYDVINPSRSLFTYHLHLTSVRNYLNEKGEQFEKPVPPPYKLLEPSGFNKEAEVVKAEQAKAAADRYNFDPRNPSGR